jgi:DNA-binding CsgD family transcriptional regulator
MVTFSPSQPLSKISVLCGFNFLGESIADSLELRGLANYLEHPLDVIFDANWGFAMTAPLNPNRISIIVTDNPCPEYWELLWERGPTVLISGRNLDVNYLINVAQRIDKAFRKGERIKDTPYYQSKLSKAERKVFWWAVQREGYSNEKIAEHAFLSVQTVNNLLSSIYSKLELLNRTQLVLYFQHGEKGESELQSSSQLPRKSVANHQAN